MLNDYSFSITSGIIVYVLLMVGIYPIAMQTLSGKDISFKTSSCLFICMVLTTTYTSFATVLITEIDKTKLGNFSLEVLATLAVLAIVIPIIYLGFFTEDTKKRNRKISILKKTDS